jgi:hypothetical protein
MAIFFDSSSGQMDREADAQHMVNHKVYGEHGLFTITMEGNLLVVDGIGPFNEQTITSFHAALNKAITTISSKQWSQIIVLHAMSLFTPEAERQLCVTLIERKKQGLIKSAVVYGDTDCKSMIQTQLSRCYANVGIDHGFFETIDEAKTWLANK